MPPGGRAADRRLIAATAAPRPIHPSRRSPTGFPATSAWRRHEREEGHMPSSVPAHPVAERPPEQLLDVFQHLTTITAECLLAIVVGLVGSRLMRARRLHWSWAASTAALAILARGALGSAALPLGLGALT